MKHNINLKRFSDGGKSTLGLLFIDGVWNCYTLEDTFQYVKIPGQTRIPEGSYEIKLNTTAGMNDVYKQRYPSFHSGMLEVCDVQNFTYIFIHQGTTCEDTAGCILVGFNVNNNKDYKGCILESAKAYVKIYTKISDWLTSGEKCYILVETLEPVQKRG